MCSQSNSYSNEKLKSRISNKKILIIENESIIAKDIQNTMMDMGFKCIHIALSEKDAIEKSKKFHPDLILVDIKLKEDMDGIECSKKIHSQLNIPVIFISALSDMQVKSEAKEIDPFYFLSKPIEEDKLQAILRKAFFQ